MFGSILGSIAGAAVSGLLSNKGQKDAGAANAALQREFAQNGIRWKVEDAKAAGIHPLYAMGAPTVSASPSYMAGSVPDLSGVGQDIGRAIDAKRTGSERVTARLEALSVERAQLENDLLRSQIAKVNQPASPPPLPGGNDGFVIDGQGNSRVSTVPMERNASVPGLPALEAGSVNDLGFARTGSGGYAPVPSQDVKQRLEDTFLPETMWSFRNMLTPNFGFGSPPPDSALPKGFNVWNWSIARQQWEPGVRRSSWQDYSTVPDMIRAYRRGER